MWRNYGRYKKDILFICVILLQQYVIYLQFRIVVMCYVRCIKVGIHIQTATDFFLTLKQTTVILTYIYNVWLIINDYRNSYWYSLIITNLWCIFLPSILYVFVFLEGGIPHILPAVFFLYIHRTWGHPYSHPHLYTHTSFLFYFF